MNMAGSRCWIAELGDTAEREQCKVPTGEARTSICGEAFGEAPTCYIKIVRRRSSSFSDRTSKCSALA